MRAIDTNAYAFAHYFPVTTGLPVVVWVSVKVAHHSPFIKVGAGFDASVSIEDTPKILEGSLSPSILKEVSKWIILNKKVLLKYWNMEIDAKELTDALVELLF